MRWLRAWALCLALWLCCVAWGGWPAAAGDGAVPQPVESAGMHHAEHGDAHAPAEHGHEAAKVPPGHDHEAMMRELATSASDAAPTPEMDVGVDEHLGAYLPEGLTFTDSDGDAVDLRAAASVPSIILPVYFTCPSVCNLMLSSFARILPEVPLDAGRELRVIAVSFDELDTPAVAAASKRNYMAALRGGFPPEHWLFLTGDKATIDRAMDAIGFGFARRGDAFVHPAVAVAVAPDGKIVRYLYGTDFLPFDVTMAATEAAQGRVGLSVKRLLSYCFDYDPQGRRYVFDTMRVVGGSILGLALVLFIVLMLAGRRTRGKGERDG
ncbi:protein SCO1/2 [Desulfobaculum xiamenense]|uniref:Protein SCO1/2 n=1 Tax=Desulfobaculum xiamenense TaxID=995050 RepID=A0A846QGA8_9BACT|nr:SCO family protein [Desulfobaculum xiamenense]NJB67836.1 protein SCO1/2 [Desulfobaculum xiamenense]